MAEYTIEIEIKEGKVHATVKGVDGPQCGDLSRFLDQMGTVETDQPTADSQKATSIRASSTVKG